MVNRYYAFGSENHYPCGGMNDFLMSSDDLDECVEACKRYYNRGRRYNDSWTEIWDMYNNRKKAMVWDEIVWYDIYGAMLKTQKYEWTTVE